MASKQLLLDAGFEWIAMEDFYDATLELFDKLTPTGEADAGGVAGSLVISHVCPEATHGESEYFDARR